MTPRRGGGEINVCWCYDEPAAGVRGESAAELAAVLAEVPRTPAGVPVALKSSAGVGRQHPLGQPISYTAAGVYLAELPPIQADAGKSNERKERRVRVLRSNPMDVEAKAHVGRAGTGGRNAPPQVLTQTTATRELIELIGPPVEVRNFGSMRLQVYLYDENGDGIVCARLSGRDIQNGETALGQVHPALEGIGRLELKPRHILVATDVSGGNFLRDRPDLLFIKKEIAENGCNWVWFRGVDRIARRPQVFYTFAEELESVGVDLYLTEIPGRPVDWENDEIHLGFNSLMGSRERRAIYKRTHSALVSRWLNEGRGWPGGLPFGFRRNAQTDYPEIDPVQWPFVRMAFELYALNEDGEGGGVRAIQKALAEAGCELADSTIRRILKKPVYFTGEWTTRRAGLLIENRPIEIPEGQRIAPELYEKVQNLLRLRRGKDMRTPPGKFALNRIGRLADGTRIRARVTTKDENETIYYRPYMVKKGERTPARWRGLRIEANALEGAVFGEMLRLANCIELQEEWTKIAHPNFGATGPILSDEARADLERKIHNLDAAIAKLDRNMAMRVADEGIGDRDLFAERRNLVGPLEADKRAMEEQLRRADVIDSMRKTTKPKVDSSLLEALEQIFDREDEDDADLILKRTAFLERALSSVVIDVQEDGRVLCQLHGPLVPSDVPVVQIHDPVTVLADELSGEVKNASVDQPSHKSSLTTELVKGINLPAIGTRNPNKMRPAISPGARDLVPAWSSPFIDLPVMSARHDGGTKGKSFYDPDVIALVLSLRAGGCSLEAIARELDRRGAPTPRGGNWSAATVGPLLRRLRERGDAGAKAA